MKYLLLSLSVLSLFSCSQPHDNGGACTYETDTVAATVIRMDSTNTPYPDIWLTAEQKNGTVDTIRYSENLHMSPTWEQCPELGLSVGARFKCERQTISSGDCDPVLFRLTKLKY